MSRCGSTFEPNNQNTRYELSNKFIKSETEMFSPRIFITSLNRRPPVSALGVCARERASGGECALWQLLDRSGNCRLASERATCLFQHIAAITLPIPGCRLPRTRRASGRAEIDARSVEPSQPDACRSERDDSHTMETKIQLSANGHESMRWTSRGAQTAFRLFFPCFGGRRWRY